MGAATTVQGRFQYFNDNGTEAGATAKASINTDWAPGVSDLDTPFRLRVEISTSGMIETAGNYVINLSVNDGTFLPITATSTNGVKSVPSGYGSPPADNSPTTERMSGSGTFLAGDWDNTGATGSIQIDAGQDCEIEFCLQLDSANLSGGEKLEFQVYRDTTPLDSYTVTPTIASAPTPPVSVIDQDSFRWRDDDGDETGATWLAALNNNPLGSSLSYATNYRPRFLLQETAANDKLDGYYLYYSIDDGAWTRVTTSSSYVRSVTSGNVSDGDPTTKQLGSGTFDEGALDTNGVIAPFTLTGSQESELEWVIEFQGADFSGTEKVELQVRFDSGSVLDSYTNTPTISSMPTPPAASIEQGSFRWRSEGAEETINQDTWEAALDTDVTLDMMTVHGGLLTRLRAELVEVNGMSKTITPKLQYRINAGSWVTPRAWNYLDPGAETGTFDPVMIVNKATTTDGAATTAVITSATGFVAGTMNHDATAANVTLNNQHTELEWAILISHFYNTQQYLSDGDTIDFRVVESDDTLLDGTYDYPRVTVNIPDGYIGGTGIETSQNFSFIKIPDGTLYAPIEDAEIGSNIMMLKSSDGGKSWTPQDNGVVLVANDMEAFSMAYDDTRKVIHCLHVGGDAEYYQFGTKDHSTDADQWIEIGGAGVYRQQIEAGIDATNQTCELILRGATLYAFYPDDTAPEVIYYKKKTDTSTTNNWGSRVAVDSTGGTTDFSGVSAVVGPKTGGAGEPLIHIFYSDHSNLDIFHRSLDTSDVLGTIHTITTDLKDEGAGLPMGLTNAIAWESGGSEYAMIAFQDGSDSYLYSVIVQDDGTPDSAQLASNSVAVLANPTEVNARQPVASLGLDGTTAWIFYADDATADLWRASNANGAGWTGHAEELDGVTVHAVRGQAFTHSAGNGGATVFGYIWETQYNQGGTPKSGYEGTNRYDEYVITAGGDASKSVTDTGSGTEAISNITVGLGVSDAGTAVEVMGGQASLAVAEVGSASESVSLSALIQIMDVAAGAGLISFPSIIASVADVAAGSDIVQDLQVSLQIPDAGSASEGLTLAAQLSVSDSASASDIVTTLKQLFKTVNDLASGSDEISGVTVSLSLADAGAGLEALSIAALASITDAGSGSDNLTDLIASLSVPDVGSASEVPGIAADLAVTDAGSASEAPAISAGLTIADSGSIVEVPAIAAELAISDTASGLDVIIAYTLIAVADVASAIDGLGSITINLTVPDAGSATEAPSIAADLAVADAGSAAEAPAISAGLAVVDSGSAADDLSGLGVSFTIPDSGSGAEGNPAVVASLTISDLGSTTEAPAIVVDLAVSDSGSASEVINILTALLKSVTDSASGVDSVTDISVSASVADTAAGNEAIQIAVALSVTDAAGATEAIDILQATLINIADTAAGNDLVSGITVSLAVADSAAGNEAVQISTSLSIADVGSGLDSINILSALLKSIADAGSGLDSISAVSASLAVSDAGSGSEAVDLAVNLAVSDSGAGLESLLLNIFTNVADVGSGSDGVGPVSVDLSIADVGTATEILNVLIEVYKLIADAGTGLDSIQDVVVQVPVSDMATASDFISSVLVDVLVADLASGVDVVAQFDPSFSIVAFTFSFKRRTIDFVFSSRLIDFTSGGGLQSRTVTFDLTQLEV